MRERSAWIVFMGISVLAARPALAGDAAAGEAASVQSPPDPDPRWQVNSSLSARRYSIEQPAAATDGLAFDLDLACTAFLEPLREDGAPYTLQPFLQRSSTLFVDLDVNRFATRNPTGGEDRTSLGGGLSVGADDYVKPWLALRGRVGYGFSGLHDEGVDQSTRVFSASAAVGVRAGNVRIDASYGLVSLETSNVFAPLRHSYGLSLFTAIARRFTARVSASIVPAGVEGDLSMEYFPSRGLGIFAGTAATRGKLYTSESISTRYGDWIGAAWWIDGRLGILGRYDLTLEDTAQPGGQAAYDEVSHAGTFAFFARFD